MLSHIFKVLYNKLQNRIYNKLPKTKIVLLYLKKLLKSQKQALYNFLKTLNKQCISPRFMLIK